VLTVLGRQVVTAADFGDGDRRRGVVEVPNSPPTIPQLAGPGIDFLAFWVAMHFFPEIAFESLELGYEILFPEVE
jgi:hypothetical protein